MPQFAMRSFNSRGTFGATLFIAGADNLFGLSRWSRLTISQGAKPGMRSLAAGGPKVLEEISRSGASRLAEECISPRVYTTRGVLRPAAMMAFVGAKMRPGCHGRQAGWLQDVASVPPWEF